MPVQGRGPAARLRTTIPYRCSWRASWPRALLHMFSFKFSHLALPSRKTLSTSSGFAKLKPAAIRRQRELLPTPPQICGCSACQAQSMAAIPTFIGVGGPILSLTGEQRTEYALFLRDNSFCVATTSTSCSMSCTSMSKLLNLNCVLPHARWL
ncbi:hypothetical protein BGY98DRAFT_340819 [Russula aff. rugulosa BPL654]|nr:hypothetical protein BGY98DRAFT_340819 [Russula aff. rugulosa BPL654]